MARGRLISRSLGSSRKFHALLRAGGRLGEFCQVLFPLIIANTDDFGRLPGDAFTIKNVVLPSSQRLEKDFNVALDAMVAVGLIERYQVDGAVYLQVNQFDIHQPNLNRRTQSRYPMPGDQRRELPTIGTLNASETDIELMIATDLEARRLQVDGFTVASVRRQVRVGASYIDILATTDEGTSLVIEVKRQRVTPFAISQVLEYCGVVQGPTIPVVIGYGTAESLTLPVSDVLIGTYGDDRRITTANALTVNSRVISLNHIPSEFNLELRTENLEPNLEQNPEPRTAVRVADALFDTFWAAYPKKKSKDDARKAWDKRRPDAALLQVILTALQQQGQSPDWQKEHGRYIPFPATWLNRGQWTDAVDVDLADGGVSETLRFNQHASADAERLIVEADARRTGTHGPRR